MSRTKVTYKDLGLQQIMKALKSVAQRSVHVGVVGQDAERPTADGRLTMGELALIQEYGSRKANIPARKFIRDTLTPKAVGDVARDIAKTLKSASSPKRWTGYVDDILQHAGNRLAAMVRDRILANGQLLPNAPKTIEKKGVDYPLVETAEFAHAISSKVVRGTMTLELDPLPEEDGE